MAIIYGYPDSEINFLAELPKEVKSIDDIDEVHKEMKQEFDSIEDKGLGNKFSRWRKKRKINKIEDNIDSPLHKGAKGEIQVLDKLSELSDDYHVMCGVEMDLGHYITYNRRRNLRSAQMDFVVVCPKGVFMIEVKNWSKGYAKRHDALNPHEQTDRAGRVLWIFLQSWRSKPRVTNVLLSTQGTFEYNKNYRAVFVSNLDRINNFIENREECYSEKHVKHIVGKLRHCVTK